MVILREGMQIPADGILLRGSEVTCDESAMTGETDPLKKNTVAQCIEMRNQIIADGGKN
jgi:P-type E1-E2 ATPase